MMKKKQIKQKTRPSADKQAEQMVRENSKLNRRQFLDKLGYGAGGLAIVGGLGYWGTTAVIRTMNESDLSRIGKGLPAIVQIHDPQCSLCLALQKQTRSALSSHNEEKFDFLVANIKSKSGRELANRYGVSHVTLLMFDAKGTMVRVLQGPTSASNVQNTVDLFLSTNG